MTASTSAGPGSVRATRTSGTVNSCSPGTAACASEGMLINGPETRSARTRGLVRRSRCSGACVPEPARTGHPRRLCDSRATARRTPVRPPLADRAEPRSTNERVGSVRGEVGGELAVGAGPYPQVAHGFAALVGQDAAGEHGEVTGPAVGLGGVRSSMWPRPGRWSCAGDASAICSRGAVGSAAGVGG